MGCGKSKPRDEDQSNGLNVDPKPTTDETYKFKLLLIGNSSVGKSSLLMRFADKSFPTEYMNTIGIDYKTHTIDVSGKSVKLQMWDTAGQERFRTITASYYRGAHGIFLVFDVTEEKSFKDVSDWLEEIRTYANKSVAVVLVGNKVDLAHKRKVSFEDASQYAKDQGVLYTETSALSGENVDQTFRSLAEDLLSSDFANQQLVS